MDTTVTKNDFTYTSHLIPGGDMLVVTLKNTETAQQTVLTLDHANRTATVLTQHVKNPERFDAEMENVGWAVVQIAKDLHAQGMEYLHGPSHDPKRVKINIDHNGTVTLEDISSGEVKSTATVSDDGVILHEHNAV